MGNSFIKSELRYLMNSPRTCSSGQRRRRRCRRRSRLGQGYGWHPPWPVMSMIKRSINDYLRSTQIREIGRERKRQISRQTISPQTKTCSVRFFSTYAKVKVAQDDAELGEDAVLDVGEILDLGKSNGIKK